MTAESRVTGASPFCEISESEWNSRKLSRYGFFSWLIDIILVAAMFSAMGCIAISIIPNSLSEQIQFWMSVQLILFIMSLKKIFILWNPLNHYQTLVIRKE